MQTVVPTPKTHEPATWQVQVRLEKRTGDWTPEQIAQGVAAIPYEVLESEGNLLVTNGVLQIWKALTGGAYTAFSNANARIGVGDGNGSVPTAAAADTDLTAPTNK